MKKTYYLQPGWEIIPRGKSILISNIKNNKKYSLDNLSVPDIMSFLYALRGGISCKLILSDYKEAVIKLKKAGAIICSSSEVDCDKRYRDYFDLLKNHLLGIGKIVQSLKTISTGTSFHVEEALGLSAKFIQYQPTLNYGWGCDPNPQMAKIKAVVECVERYSISDYCLGDFEKMEWSNKIRTLSPIQLNTAYSDIKNCGPIHWGRLEKVDDSDHIYAPLDFLYHPVDYWSLGRMPVCPMNISGIAGHQSIEAANVNAFLELCEHEALMVAWFGKRTTPTINVKSLDKQSQQYLKMLEEMGYQIILKDISLDLVPAVMAIAIGSKRKRALTIGSNAAFTLKYAANKAILELIKEVLLFESEKSKTPKKMKASNVNDVLAHAQYYYDHKNLKRAKFLWNHREVVDATDLLTHGEYKGQCLSKASEDWEKTGKTEKHELNYLKSIFKQAQLDIFSMNITPKEIVRQKIPLFIVRALVPEMARLVVGYGLKPAQTKRFKSLLKQYRQEGIVPKVHPFS